MNIDDAPTEYKDGWFDFAKAVPCWVRFATDKATKIVCTNQRGDFKVTVKPKVDYAAKILLVNSERTFATFDFPEFQGYADGLDLTFAVPEFFKPTLPSTDDLASFCNWASKCGLKLSAPLNWKLDGLNIKILSEEK